MSVATEPTTYQNPGPKFWIMHNQAMGSWCSKYWHTLTPNIAVLQLKPPPRTMILLCGVWAPDPTPKTSPHFRNGGLCCSPAWTLSTSSSHWITQITYSWFRADRKLKYVTSDETVLEFFIGTYCGVEPLHIPEVENMVWAHHMSLWEAL